MVVGPWGCGKTYKVRQALNSIAKRRVFKGDPLRPDDPIWVSLFGVETPSALDAAIVAASDRSAHVGFGGLRTIGNLSRGVGGFFAAGAVAAELTGPLLRRSLLGNNHRVLVFDDVERSGMDLDTLLGSINNYLENMSFKVVMVADERQFGEAYFSRKEKIVGQTLPVYPEYDTAYDSFSAQITDPGKRCFVNNHKATVIRVFSQAEVPSLRILHHVIWDLARLAGCLSEDQRGHEAGITAMVETFCALNALVREGLLKPSDLEGRMDKWVAREMARPEGWDMAAELDEEGGKPADASSFNIACKRFEAGAKILTSHVLSDDLLRLMLVEGVYDREQVQQCLSESGYFGSPLEERSWWRVWHRYERDDADVLSDIVDLEHDFEQRNYINGPEILHLFSLRLSLAQEGLLAISWQDEIVDQCKNYVDDLLDAGRLPRARRHDRDDFWDFERGAYGLSYSIRAEDGTKAAFDALFDQLVQAQQTALKESYKVAAQEMIARLNLGTPESISSLVHDLVDAKNGRYALMPIFSDENPRVFFDAILKLRGSLWVSILRALRSRYYGVQLENGLDGEINWILGLMELLRERAATVGLPPIERARINWFVNNFKVSHIERRQAKLEAN